MALGDLRIICFTLSCSIEALTWHGEACGDLAPVLA